MINILNSNRFYFNIFFFGIHDLCLKTTTDDDDVANFDADAKQMLKICLICKTDAMQIYLAYEKKSDTYFENIKRNVLFHLKIKCECIALDLSN